MLKEYLKLLFSYILLFCSSLLCAQNEFSNNDIIGSIFFENDSTPIYGANIQIKNTLIGTASNSDGEFILHIKTKNSQDTLIISCIGYKDYAIKLSKFLKTPIKVYLEENPLLLNSVLITSLTGKEIMRRAIEKMDDNYSQEEKIYDIYIKDIYNIGAKHSRFQEVSADVVSKGFFVNHKRKEAFEIFLKGKRTSFDNDTDFFESNDISLLFQANWARSFLRKQNINKYKFIVEGITSYQNFEVYKLLVETTFKDALAVLYITTQSYALVSVDYFYENLNTQIINKRNEWSWIKFRFYLDFYEKDTKWYLRTVSDYRKTLERDGRVHESNRTLRVLDVQNIEKNIVRSNHIDHDDDLYDFPMQYNPEFWKNYNAPPETEEEKRIKAELIQQ